MIKIFTIVVFYTISFLLIAFIKNNSIIASEKLQNLYLIYIFSTIFSSLVLGKFSKRLNNEFISLSKTAFKAFVLNLGIITLTVNFISGFSESRLLIVGSLTLGLLLEFIHIVLISELSHKSKDKSIFSFSVIFLIIEFIILTWLTFYSLFSYEFPDYSFKQKILFIIILYTIWFVSSSINRHSDVSTGSTFLRVVWNHLASYIILFLIVSSLVFLLGLPIEIKKLAIYNILLFSFWSLTAVIVYYLYTSSPKTDNVNFGIFNTTEFPDEYYDSGNEELKEDNTLEYISEKYNLLREQLKNIYLKKFPNVFEFLGQNLNLRSYDISECVILRSADTYNVEVIPYQSISLYMNLHELNDIKRINEYFIEINKRLKQNGYFIGRFQSNHLRYHEYHKKYPFYLANLIYSFDFIWKRMFPKLPVLKRIFYFLSRGRNRALSMAEGLGRLYYCGFNVKAVQEINGHLYFIARKDKEPSTDINPSYGLFFKMKRVGQFGKTIYVYKIRTMHPYSEYLQKFVFDNIGTSTGDKISKDFRVTQWGRILRKFWIDELPMIINLVKRELKLVGIRPLSFHKFSLYPKDVQELRNKSKPGLLPPYYADLPNDFEELLKSEEKYLQSYFCEPLKTDLRYLKKIIHNIVIKKTRSS